MSDYDKVHGAINAASAAVESDFTKKNLDDADSLKRKGQTQLYTSYRWLKTSAKMLYKLLQRVERSVKIRDRKEKAIDEYFDLEQQLDDMTDE